MSKWEDSLKKTTNETSNTCQCTRNEGLFVPNRQLSALVAGLLFLFFCFFMTGYFVGKKYIVEQFIQDMQQDVQAVSLQNSVILTKNDHCVEAHGALITNDENNKPYEVSHDCVVQPSAVITINQDIIVPDKKEQKYYAQLIGFVTEIKKRVSKTVKGRVSYWYQVVTAPYSNKNDLLCVVDTLVKKERLKDVCIQMC